MMFTKHGQDWKVDQFGALWFCIEGTPEARLLGKTWLRWCAIDVS